MSKTWVLFESGRIRGASPYAFRSNSSTHALVKVGGWTLEVPDRSFIDVGDACLIEGRFLRAKWFGPGLIRHYGHPMPEGLRGEELEAHAIAWLHRDEAASAVVHANVMGETKSSLYLKQDAGECAILPRALVERRGELFQVPEWAIEHSDLQPVTVAQVLLYGETNSVLGAGLVVAEFTAEELEEGLQFVLANDGGEFDVGQFAIIKASRPRAILPKTTAVEHKRDFRDLTLADLKDFRGGLIPE